MEEVLLLIVEDTFLISRGDEKVLILLPDFSVPPAGWQECEVDLVLSRPDGRSFRVKGRLEMSHFNIRDPEVSMDRRWRLILCLIGVGKEEVPRGSSILGSRDLHPRLRG